MQCSPKTLHLAKRFVKRNALEDVSHAIRAAPPLTPCTHHKLRISSWCKNLLTGKEKVWQAENHLMSNFALLKLFP
jgi:hypothetical protein